MRDTGRLEAADELMSAAFLSQREVLGSDHSDVGFTLFHLGILAALRGQYEDAEKLLRESLAIAEAASRREPSYLADILHELGTVCEQRGRASEAEELFRRVLEIRRDVLPAGHADIRLTEAALAALVDSSSVPIPP